MVARPVTRIFSSRRQATRASIKKISHRVKNFSNVKFLMTFFSHLPQKGKSNVHFYIKCTFLCQAST